MNRLQNALGPVSKLNFPKWGGQRRVQRAPGNDGSVGLYHSTSLTRFHVLRQSLVLVMAFSAPAVEALGEGIFPDENLEKVVRRYVFEKRNNEEPITEKDVERISTIEGKGKGIKDLTGLEKCHSLALLNLENNEISDIKALAELDNLQSLNLAKNKIKDIGPLEKLVRLQLLDLSNNEVSDLKPLAKMDNMRSLYLSSNKITDIAPVAELKKIWSLYLDGNQIKDLSPVSKLKWLSSLRLKNTGISDLSALKELTELKFLHLEGNQIEDLTPLVEMAKKDEKEQRFSPFWRIYLANNPLKDGHDQQLEVLKKLGGRITREPTP